MTSIQTPSRSMARYIHDRLRLYRIGLPFVLSITAGLVFGASVFVLRAKSDFQLISSISGHLSSLVETHDRPEMLKILKSIAAGRDVSLRVIHDGKIFANSGAGSELDSMPKPRSPFLSVSVHEFTAREMISTSVISRVDGPSVNSTIELATPIQPLILLSIAAMLLINILSLFFSRFYSNRITKLIRMAMKPVEDLEKLVEELVHLNSEPKLNPIGITELDNIQRVIVETRRSLSDATDRLAESRAKELLAESYQRLIHDLYTPVAALKEVVKKSQMTSSQNPKELSEKMVRLAGQVLNQVTTANENLNVESRVLENKDIRDCVSEATDQAVLAFQNDKGVVVRHKIPGTSVLIPHDPEYLKRAVSNLVSNALRASKKSVEVEIERNESSVFLRVSDDGDGIRPEELTALLHGRIQSKNADRPGFGLPSANHIARLHGGRLVYRASPLGGACFEMRLG